MKVTWIKKGSRWDDDAKEEVEANSVFTGDFDPDSRAWKRFLKTVKASEPSKGLKGL